MSNPRLEDHLVGLELQLVELVENRKRAAVQGRIEDAKELDREIAGLQLELAASAEQLGGDEPEGAPKPALTATTAITATTASKAEPSAA